MEAYVKIVLNATFSSKSSFHYRSSLLNTARTSAAFPSCFPSLPFCVLYLVYFLFSKYNFTEIARLACASTPSVWRRTRVTSPHFMFESECHLLNIMWSRKQCCRMCPSQMSGVDAPGLPCSMALVQQVCRETLVALFVDCTFLQWKCFSLRCAIVVVVVVMQVWIKK